ncbi:amidase signature domain-containing protein [Phialemonium atrogriseum]|uniref:Amidase signature domain-containing protein n=1 Tax=Phialemonium atrogriseum TaxID=1093897 RepID=A0AAJ0C8H4_9PEZI|nr:amidase signature domain-containing protein [Phialemonium atrogriseum]KAK1772100.1 amidase signature domain-containing protein [Phialemonium atrogriseum]
MGLAPLRCGELSFSQLLGRALNSFNGHPVAGGSSGGEGAIVGLHGSPMGIATDIAGSIRIP